MGPLLQLGPHLGALPRRRNRSRAHRVRAHFEALSADVREHRDCDRQGPCGSVGAVGALDRLHVQAIVSRKTDAGAYDTRRAARANLQLTCTSEATTMATMNGTIKRLTDKGFGFIAASDGTEYFFHQSACSGTRFDELREGQAVTFERGQGPKGPRAENVRVA